MRATLVCATLGLTAGFNAGLSAVPQQPAAQLQRAAVADVQMLNLFGNNEESKLRRSDLSLRGAPPGSRKVSFRKPNSATDGISMGLKFREGFGRRVLIDKVVEGTEAARLKQQGKLREGDEVVMVSATFGDEMWSARGVGKMRLEKSIAVRQGMTISFVLENADDTSARRINEMKKKQEKERAFNTRLQKQLQDETDAAKAQKGGGFFGGLFGN